MISVKLEIDYSKFEKKMDLLAEQVIPYMRVTWMEIAEYGLRRVQALTPTTRPGRTDIKSLWFLDESVQGKVQRFIIHNLYKNQDVLVFFEYGTRPHEIRPRFSRYLHFFLENGKEIFTKVVFHPGTPAYRMVEQTEKELDMKVQQYVSNTMHMVDEMLRYQ